MKNKKSFEIPSSKPVDIEYRLRRALQSVSEALIFINAIDPAALGEESIHGDMVHQASVLLNSITRAQNMAPQKKARKTKATEFQAEENQAIAAE